MSDTYLVTGAGRGLGLALARRIAATGARVVGTARDPDRAGELASIAAQVLRLNVTDAGSIGALGGRLGDGPVDVLINNAGVSSDRKTLDSLDAADLQHVMMVNAIAPVLVAKSLLPNLRAGRRRIIVNITSQLGSIANNTGGSSYGYRASKAALNMLTRSMANELRSDGFTCVAVHPGWVRTDMGGEQAPLSPEESAADLVALIARLSPADSGAFLNHDGRPMPW